MHVAMFEVTGPDSKTLYNKKCMVYHLQESHHWNKQVFFIRINLEKKDWFQMGSHSLEWRGIIYAK